MPKDLMSFNLNDNQLFISNQNLADTGHEKKCVPMFQLLYYKKHTGLPQIEIFSFFQKFYSATYIF